MNIVETSGLGKRYGSTWALRDCSLAIPAGHVAALVGSNGAGKTTLLNLAVGWRNRPRAPSPCWAAWLRGPRPRWTASRSSPRTRRCTGTCRRRHAAPDPQPEPALGWCAAAPPEYPVTAAQPASFGSLFTAPSFRTFYRQGAGDRV
jgi:hypothetical protein